jgi:hypothetical protein
VSRSLHTDPYPLRAIRRVGAPRRRRDQEPRVARRQAKLNAARDAGPCPGTDQASMPSPNVHVHMCPARRGFVHPASVADITALLSRLGPIAVYGLRHIELRHLEGDDRSRVLVAALRMPGVVVLYEQACPPWLISGRLASGSLRRLERAGAQVDMSASHTWVGWPDLTLRNFMLFDGLVHEIGHHMIQHGAGRATAPVMRTADHERLADAFAAGCRRAWTMGTTP